MPTAADIIVRTNNTEPHKHDANSFAALDEVTAFIGFRLDGGIWAGMPEDDRVRATVSAYRELVRLTWRRNDPIGQSRDIAPWSEVDNDPPLDDPQFVRLVKQAQAVQALYLANGSQVRDMARDGIKMTRQLTGSELEISGYQGPVCAEAREILAHYIDLMPRLRRF